MFKVTTAYRHQNPVKLVFPVELGYGIDKGIKIILSDENTPDVVGVVVRAYRTPRRRHLAWVKWHGQA